MDQEINIMYIIIYKIVANDRVAIKLYIIINILTTVP